MHNIIEVNKLSKSFKSNQNNSILTGLFKPDWKIKHAVENISFTIKPGEAVAFLGPNGAGKTTTTKMLTGLIKPTSGNIRVLSENPFDKKPMFLKKIGLVMGNKAGLNWDLSARQSFELIQRIYDIPKLDFQKDMDELAKLLDVSSLLDKQVRKLSLGERMKLEVVGAILHDPDILFLDEPTIGLDIDSKKNIRKFLIDLNTRGKTLLLTSHDMDDISSVCQRAIIINHGKIIFDGSMETLNSKYSNTRYLNLTFSDKSPNEEYLKGIGEVVRLAKGKLVLKVDKNIVMQAATKISQKYPIHDITIDQVALEEIILDLFKTDKQSI